MTLSEACRILVEELERRAAAHESIAANISSEVGRRAHFVHSATARRYRFVAAEIAELERIVG